MGFDFKDLIGPAINPVAFVATAAQGGLDYYNAKKDREAQDDANKANINLTREQMAFQERMSSTAHQREVDDLVKAGLNPVLSANRGASTPGGSTADVAPLPSQFKNSAATAREAIRFATELREAESRIEMNKVAAKKMGAEYQHAEENLNTTKMYNLIPRKVLDFFRSGAKDFNTFKATGSSPWTGGPLKVVPKGE